MTYLLPVDTFALDCHYAAMESLTPGVSAHKKGVSTMRRAMYSVIVHPGKDVQVRRISFHCDVSSVILLA